MPLARPRRRRAAAKPVPFTPAAPTAAVIWTNGQRQVVGLHQVFNVGDAQFRLLAVTRKAMRIEAVGGAFAGGKQAIRVRKGHAAEARQHGDRRPVPAPLHEHGAPTLDPASSRLPTTAGRQLSMNPIQRKATAPR